jgi:Family of unknown function (DUF6152)
MRALRMRAVAASLLCLCAAASAHHSQGMFVETPVWVTGTIVRYRPVDPHVMIELREVRPDGKGRKWIIEGPRRGRLEWILQNNGNLRDDQILKAGDQISVCGFPLRRDWDPDRMYADWPPEQGRFVHGQVMLMPDGRLQSWGPYGAIDNCVRKGDAAATWVSFLNRDPLAHRQWCDAMTHASRAHLTTRAYLNEVNRGLSTACR